MKNYVIILASGSSNRFGDKIPKQFIEIEGQTILEKSIDAFEKNSNITDIILITNPDYIEYTQNLVKGKFSKLRTIHAGGKTRQESSAIGVSLIKEPNANVLIHDAARPFVSQEIITNCIKALETNKAVGVAINSNDTIIKVDENGFIKEIPNRNFLRRIQTPQCFKLDIIKTAQNAPPKVIIAEGASRKAIIPAKPASPKEIEIITKIIATTRPAGATFFCAPA